MFQIAYKNRSRLPLRSVGGGGEVDGDGEEDETGELLDAGHGVGASSGRDGRQRRRTG
jgi:hypothetical protein